MRSITLSLILIIFLCSPVQAAVRYVNPACESACDGTTWEKGWAAFGDIVWGALDDEESTLYLGAGSYSTQLTIAHNADSRLTIQPYDGLVTITGSAGHGIQLGNNSGGVARNVTINGLYEGNRSIRITGNAYHGVYYRYASNMDDNYFYYLEIDTNGSNSVNEHGMKITGDGIRVASCYIHDNYNDGINGYTATTGAYAKWLIYDNIIEDNGEDGIGVNCCADIYDNKLDGTNCVTASHPDGIDNTGSLGYMRIYGNEFIEFTQQVFIETPSNASLAAIRIYNNTGRRIGSGDPKTAGIVIRIKNTGEGSFTLSDTIIANNVFDALDQGCLRIFSDYATTTVSTSEISNNIFYNCSYNANLYEELTYVKAGLLFYNNILYGTDSISYNALDDGGGPYDTASDLNTGTGFTGNTNSQPVFTNYAGFNYSLSAEDTAALNAGKTLSDYFTTDKNGTDRPQGAAWDIGAYEYDDEEEPEAPTITKIKWRIVTP